MHRPVIVLRAIVIVAAVTVAGVSLVRGAPAAAVTRMVYVTVTDSKGVPVADLTAADFQVKEGGKVRQVMNAGPPTRLLQVGIIVDDNGTGLFRVSIANFIQRLYSQAEFAITTVVGQPLKLVDYTRDLGALTQAVGSLVPRPETRDGGMLLSGIFEAAIDLAARKAPRSMILALTVGGEEQSELRAQPVLDRLRDSGAALYVISVAASSMRPTAPIGASPMALLESNFQLQQVLGDGSKQSGGTHGEIVATAGLMTGIQRMAEQIANQYEVTYVLPDGVKPDSRLEVSVTRRGLTVRAPTRIPIAPLPAP